MGLITDNIMIAPFIIGAIVAGGIILIIAKISAIKEKHKENK